MVEAYGSTAAEPEMECHAYPVESPLTAGFDPVTGVLTLESTIHRGAGDRGLVRLRLTFAPDAAHGFVRLLKAVEKELGAAIADQSHPIVRQ